MAQKTRIQIQEEIDEYQELVNSSAPQDEKEYAKKQIEKLKQQLASAPTAEKKVSPKAAAKKVAPKRDRSKEKKKTNPRLKELKFEVNGEKISLTDANCMDVMTAFANRLEKSKQSQGKYRTKPITQKVGDSFEGGAKHVAEAVTQSRIDNQPKEVISGVKMMEAAYEKLFEGFETATGKKVPAEKRKAIMAILEEIKEEAKASV